MRARSSALRALSGRSEYCGDGRPSEFRCSAWWGVCREFPSPDGLSMVTEVVVRLATCPGCLELFSICSSCDRGHRYCGRRCSWRARRVSLRRARRRHRGSPEGRVDHRDAERRRRARRRAERGSCVGDHGSHDMALGLTLSAPGSNSEREDKNRESRCHEVEWLARRASTPIGIHASRCVALRCVVCGRRSSSVDVHAPPWRRRPRSRRRPV